MRSGRPIAGERRWIESGVNRASQGHSSARAVTGPSQVARRDRSIDVARDQKESWQIARLDRSIVRARAVKGP